MNEAHIVREVPVVRRHAVVSGDGRMLRVRRHVAEEFGVVREVVRDLVVAGVDHVGSVGRHVLDFVHVQRADGAVLIIHVVTEIT